jgi:hypothetical protein
MSSAIFGQNMVKQNIRMLQRYWDGKGRAAIDEMCFSIVAFEGGLMANVDELSGDDVVHVRERCV